MRTVPSVRAHRCARAREARVARVVRVRSVDEAEEVNAEAVNLLPPGGEDEALGYCVVRLLQAVDACAECERWGGASDEAVGVRQMRRGRERRKVR